MTHRTSPARLPRRKTIHRRVPAFIPVPLRGRRDGWTAERQSDFLGALAETGSVSAAAARVGMSRETAYRLRRKKGAESFAVAWDTALGAPSRRLRKVTSEALPQVALEGRLKPVIYRGKHVATVRKPDNSALLRLVSRLGGVGSTAVRWMDGTQGFAVTPASTSSPRHGARRQSLQGGDPLPVRARRGTAQSD